MMRGARANKTRHAIGLAGIMFMVGGLTSCATTSERAYWGGNQVEAEVDYNYGDYGAASTDFFYVGAGYNEWDRGSYGWGRGSYGWNGRYQGGWAAYHGGYRGGARVYRR